MLHRGYSTFYYPSRVLSVLQIVSEQIAREVRIRGLWTTVGDILDRVSALGKQKDEPLYKKNVEGTLRQIYECVLFLRWYAANGFGGMLCFLLHTRDLCSLVLF